MAAFPRKHRFLTRDAVLLVHERRIQKTLDLNGPIRANIQIVREMLGQLETAQRIERDGFAELAHGSRIGADGLYGAVKANAQVAGFLFAAAKGGNGTAQIFWLKTREGAAGRFPPLRSPLAGGYPRAPYSARFDFSAPRRRRRCAAQGRPGSARPFRSSHRGMERTTVSVLQIRSCSSARSSPSVLRGPLPRGGEADQRSALRPLRSSSR